MARLTSAFLLLLFLTFSAAQAWAVRAMVVAVHDGDTITVNDGVRVRLFGIDAPELAQPGGRESREYLAGLVLRKQVELIVRDTDQYGRTVAVVQLLDGREANALMVQAGHAWVYRKFCRPCYGMRLDETTAKMKGLGLWAGPRPVPPWVWRKRHRNM